MVRIAAVFNPELRQLLPLLGGKNQYPWDKPSLAADTAVACAESLFGAGAVKNQLGWSVKLRNPSVKVQASRHQTHGLVSAFTRM